MGKPLIDSAFQQQERPIRAKVWDLTEPHSKGERASLVGSEIKGKDGVGEFGAVENARGISEESRWRKLKSAFRKVYQCFSIE